MGNYIIDLYNNKKNIAIEIDENGHNHYNKNKENERTKYINEQIFPTWIRFNDMFPGDFDKKIIKLGLKILD